MSIEQRVAALPGMSSVEKKAEWHRRTGTSAPAAFGSGLLARALAHDLQVRALGGGLTKAELKRLAQTNRKDDRVRDDDLAARGDELFDGVLAVAGGDHFEAERL